MTETSIFARVVAAVGAVAVAVRHSGDGPRLPAYGTTPEIPAAKPQGTIPTLKMPTAKGWENGRTP
ncbi:MAG TPA: sorbosone dehydrogenase family protein, partial [Devosia sp.]